MGKKKRPTTLARQQSGLAPNRGQTLPNAPDARFEVRRASFSGPLPPPHILVQYNDAVPNGAERVLAMAEANAEHRRSLEKQVVAGNVRAQGRGQILGFILGMTIILSGAGLIYLGHEAKGFAMIASTATAMVGTFIWGRWRQEKERRDKAGAFAPPQPAPSN